MVRNMSNILLSRNEMILAVVQSIAPFMYDFTDEVGW